MDMFALNEDVDNLEQQLSCTEGIARLDLLMRLAWFLGQRNPTRQQEILQEIAQLLPQMAESETKQRYSLRLEIIDCQRAWLASQLQEGQAMAEAALAKAKQLNLPCEICDAQFFLAQLLADLGQLTTCFELLLSARDLAASTGDTIRAELFELEYACWTVMSDLAQAEQVWGARYMLDDLNLPPGVLALARNFSALVHFKHGNFGSSATYFVYAYEAALSVGLIRRAILSATNVGYSFARLNDHQAALEWKQRALDLARQSQWPASIGASLTQIADTLRQLGQLPAARELINEAVQVMSALANARNYAIALGTSADLALEELNYAGALETFSVLETRAAALQHVDFKMDALRGKAHALSWIGEPMRALQAVLEALAMAQQENDRYHEIEALKVLADLYSRHKLEGPAEIGSTSPTLHYLQLALKVAAQIAGYSIPPELFDALAREYHRLHLPVQAYNTSLQAIHAREKRHSQQATNRAIAMQVRYQTERTRAEGAYHRQLAAAEARRAATLQETSKTLERLSAIGQEITAQLDTRKVFQTLYRHVQGLLDINGFAVYLAEQDGLALSRSFGMEGGQPLPIGRVLLSNADATSARCAREKRDLVVALDPHSPAQVPGTMLNRTALFAPLLIGERLLGVMAVQSLKEAAFGERERNLFRSLCAYGAIALDNAHAYQQLQETQTQLVEQEKLVALGSLVAGVAHDLNTPLGNSLIIASALQLKTLAMDEKMQGQSLRAAELQDYLSDAEEASMLIVRGLRNAAELVNSFKQVAVDRTAAHRRVFDLHQTCNEIIATLMSQIRPTGHEISLHIPPGITMNSYPGPFGQVISDFISNALVHAFEDGRKGRMSLSAKQGGAGQVIIEFADNGCGIAPQNLSRIFDPFFTTKMGQGGNGLGLSISYNIVTSLLQGRISVTSTLGEGTVFTLDIPQVTKEQRKEQDAVEHSNYEVGDFHASATINR